MTDIVSRGQRARTFTIGHSTHAPEAFLALLAAHGVERVCDVRAFPRSRRLPHFDSGALRSALAERGFSYLHIPELGGRRRPHERSPNAGWENASFRAYADHMATPEFGAGMERLRAVAQERPTAVMCAEGLWWRCHRRLVADALLVAGFEVLHIGPDGGSSPHHLTEFAEVRGRRITYPPRQRSLEPHEEAVRRGPG